MQEADGVTVGGYQVKILMNKHCGQQVRLFVASEEKVEGTTLCAYVYGRLILQTQ
jgi:hypothetical protein